MIGGKVNDELFKRARQVVHSEEFERAFAELIGLEGGYVNDSDDPGGETVFGVSRRAHPDWAGWDEIDTFKKHEMEQDTWPIEERVLPLAKELYHDKYWLRIHGNFVPPDRYHFVLECFESCVNVGPKQFTKWLQTAANCFVGEGFDIQVDGAYGAKTKALVFKLIEDQKRSEMFVLALNIQQGIHYINLVTKRPTLRKYFMGWLGKRVII